MIFFDHKDLGNHLLQLCPKVVKHPVYNSHTELYILVDYIRLCGPGSSVGIVTDYGLYGQGSNPGGDEIFRPSRPALRLIQPSVKWVPGLSRG